MHVPDGNESGGLRGRGSQPGDVRRADHVDGLADGLGRRRGQGHRERHVLRVLALDERTGRRVSLVLGPGLVGRLPADQADAAGEAHGPIDARRVGLVVEAGLGHLVG